jgi:hypothetical protein
MQEAGIILKGIHYYIEIDYKTVKGFTRIGHFNEIGSDITPVMLVDKVDEALNKFRTNVLHLDVDTSAKAFRNEIRKLGFKNEKEFNKGAKHCAITRNEDTIEFLPSKCIPPKYYFGYLPEEKVIIKATASKEKIYESLMEALKRCKTSEEA